MKRLFGLFGFLRWNYLAPRLVLLFLLLCLSEVGVGWIAKWSLELQGSAAVGARVDIAGSKASLLKTRVTLTGIEVADPESPMTNLLEAETLDLDFDTAAALRRRVVVEHGALRGVRVGGPRATSGELEAGDRAPDEAAGALPAWIGSAAAAKAERWLADLEGRFSDDAVEGLRSPELVERLRAEWPERGERLRGAIAGLEERAGGLEEAVRQAQQNPLRGLATLRGSLSELAELTQEATRLREEVLQLPRRAAEDRRRVAEARQHDEQLIRQRVSVDNLDPETLSAYLLGEQIGGPIGRLVEALRWARSLAPAAGPTPAPASTRGVDVLFAGSRPLPSLLVKRLDVAGSTRIADRPVELVGWLANATTQPELHGRPMELRLTGTGGLPFELRATVDRTGPQPRDAVVAECPSLLLPAVRLGGAKWLRLESPRSNASLAVDLSVVGDALHGEVRLVQHDFALRPARDLQEASTTDWSIADALADNPPTASRVETTVELGGDLRRPTYRFDSTLGATVARAVRSTVRGVARRRAESLLADVRRGVDGQVAELNATIAEVSGDLAGRVREQTDLLNRLAEARPSGSFQPGGVLGLGARSTPAPR